MGTDCRPWSSFLWCLSLLTPLSDDICIEVWVFEVGCFSTDLVGRTFCVSFKPAVSTADRLSGVDFEFRELYGTGSLVDGFVEGMNCFELKELDLSVVVEDEISCLSVEGATGATISFRRVGATTADSSTAGLVTPIRRRSCSRSEDKNHGHLRFTSLRNWGRSWRESFEESYSETYKEGFIFDRQIVVSVCATLPLLMNKQNTQTSFWWLFK